MNCPECGPHIEASTTFTSDPEEAQRYRRWFDEGDVMGEWGIGDVGDEVTHNGYERVVALRVETCPRCAVPRNAETKAALPP
jgi:hypothetical protein